MARRLLLAPDPRDHESIASEEQFEADRDRLTKLVITRDGDKWTVIQERVGEQNGETFRFDAFDEVLFHLVRRYDWQGVWRL